MSTSLEVPMSRRRRGFTAVLAALITAVAVLSAPAPAYATAERPHTIPALSEWHPASHGSYVFDSSSRVVIDTASGLLDPTLDETAETFAADLSALVGREVAVVNTLLPGAHDIVLYANALAAPESYTLVLGHYASIIGAADDGVFWGTRSLLQLLTRNLTQPKGTAADSPDYEHRAVAVDLTSQAFSMTWLKRFVREMSYLKLNTLNVRMLVTSAERLENNTATDAPRYTPAQVDELVAYAERYHVQVVGELGSPTHMRDVLAAHPELQAERANGSADSTLIDMADPDALPYVEDLTEEMLPHFPGSTWNSAGDRYRDFYTSAAQYEQYPSIADWAEDESGDPDAPAATAWILWQNQVQDSLDDDHRSLTVRNDQWFTGMSADLDDDIIVKYWQSGNGALTPAEIVAEGNDIINQSDSMFLTQGSAYSGEPIGMSTNIYEEWSPNEFSGGQTISANDSHLLGAEMSVWPIRYDRNEAFYTTYAFYPIRTLAQKVWGTDRLMETFDDFVPIADAIGTAPDSTATLEALSIAQTGGDVFTIYNAEAATYLTATDPMAHTGSVGTTTDADANDARWQFVDAGGGLDRIRSVAQDRCLAPADHSYASGAGLELAVCDFDNVDSSSQLWTVEERGADFALRSAGPNTVLTAGDPATASADTEAANQTWLLPQVDQDERLTVEIASSEPVVPAGSATTVTATVTNTGTSDATDVDLTIQVDPSMTAVPDGSTNLGTLAGGASGTVSWTVTADGGIASVNQQLHAEATYNSADAAGASDHVMTTSAGFVGESAYAANFLDDNLTTVDLSTGATGDPVAVGDYPGVTDSRGTTVYTADQESNTISIVDTATNTITDEVFTGYGDTGAAFAPDGSVVYMTGGDRNSIVPIIVADAETGPAIPARTYPIDITIPQ